MTAPQPLIRTLSLPEIELLVDWAGAEGWNPGLGDATTFQAADPGGFLGAFVADEMVAGISAVAYGDAFGFIGLYICRPDMRGRGYGKAVWDAGIARLGGRTIGLDGVPAQQANYLSMGFQPAYRTLRLSGRASAPDTPDIHSVTPGLFTVICDLDHMCFPAKRDGFLGLWLGPPRIAVVSVVDGVLHGFGAARACREGYKVGPLFARSEPTAAALLASLAGACAGEIHIDVPECQSGFIAGLVRQGFTAGFETSRMHRGAIPHYENSLVFGVTCLELG